MKQFAYATRGNPVVEVDILVEHYRVVVPRLAGPEPDPTRTTHECADEDQHDPHQKAPAEHSHRKPALLDRVIAIPKRV